jgi:hypothetical protein
MRPALAKTATIAKKGRIPFLWTKVVAGRQCRSGSGSARRGAQIWLTIPAPQGAFLW